MPKFSAKSKASLAKARPELRRLFEAVIFEIDCTVLDSERGKAAQEKAFNAGNSKAHFGQSPHNYTPSIAVDVVPYPLDWNDLAAFRKLGKVVKAKAKELGIPINWGGDWRSLKDFPHYELSPWRDWAKKSALIGTAAKAKPVPVAAIPAPVSVARQYPELVTSLAEKGTDMATHTAKDVQQALKDAGFDPGKIDGQIGAKTSAALKAYQAGEARPKRHRHCRSGHAREPVPGQACCRPAPHASGFAGRLLAEPHQGQDQLGRWRHGGGARVVCAEQVGPAHRCPDAGVDDHRPDPRLRRSHRAASDVLEQSARHHETARRCAQPCRGEVMLSTILIVVLILLLLGAAPNWGWSAGWGYGPFGILSLVLVVVVILVLLGRI
jgi:peptidoglycan L-alanyl-D-glutamate endopeptidase CwlK